MSADEKKTRREILEEAFDEAEEAAVDTGQEARGQSDTGAHQDGGADPAAEAGGEQGQDLGTDDKGKGEVKPGEGKKPKEREVKAKVETPDEKERKAAADASRGEQPAKTGREVSDRAPNSWKPAAREDWANIPARARAEIQRRETEIQKELSQTATIRKFSQDLAQIVQPHLPVLQAQSIAPLQAIDVLLKNANVLYRGSPEQKARQIAQIMSTYGVDVRILDKVLSSQPIPDNMKGGGNQPINDTTIPRWAKGLFDYVNGQQTREQQRLEAIQADADNEVNEGLQKFPYLQDLRHDVADILESAAKRGRVMTMEQAYERAVALDPEISQIVAQQKAAAGQRRGNISPDKRRAASTVRGTPRGPVGGNKGEKPTRRQVLEDAWDEAS